MTDVIETDNAYWNSQPVVSTTIWTLVLSWAFECVRFLSFILESTYWGWWLFLCVIFFKFLCVFPPVFNLLHYFQQLYTSVVTFLWEKNREICHSFSSSWAILSIFSFVPYAFGVIYKEPLPNPLLWGLISNCEEFYNFSSYISLFFCPLFPSALWAYLRKLKSLCH